jgi:hypothetical protein
MFQDPRDRAAAEFEATLAEAGIVQDPQAQVPEEPGTPAPASEPRPAEPTPEPSEPAPAPQTPPEPSKEDYWKGRFETVQGKYNTEIPRLHAEIRGLRSDLETLRAAAQRTPAAAPAPVHEGEAYRSFVEQFGEPGAKAMVALANQIAQAQAHEASQTVLRQEIAPVAQTVQDQARSSLHMQIAQLCPGWEAVNDDPGFVDWTFANGDRYSGRTLNELLNEAYAAGDAQRVARFFLDYKAASAPPQPQPTPTPSPSPAPGQTAMVAPTRRSTAAQDMTDGGPGKVWSRSEADRFLSDMSRGIYSGAREAEGKAIASDLSRALAEGRVL